MRTRRFARWLALAALPLLLAAAPATAASLKGVDFPDALTVSGNVIKLQGLGLRTKFFLKVYVGALYLTTPTSSDSRAIDADEPKRIEMAFLRDVGADKIVESYRERLDVSVAEQPALAARVARFLGLFSTGVREGQRLALTYLPGKGVETTLDGKLLGTVEGADFMRVVWAIWLGPNPADADLKKGMLGGS